MAHKTAHTQRMPRPRVIVLHPVAQKLLGWIRRHDHHEQWIFAKADGTPWQRYALIGHMKRLRAKLALPRDCRLYGLRHAFGTRAIRMGVELKTLSELMGHTSTRTTERYVHLAGQVEHLQAALNKAFGQSLGRK